jgi:hypothetical protein
LSIADISFSLLAGEFHQQKRRNSAGSWTAHTALLQFEENMFLPPSLLCPSLKMRTPTRGGVQNNHKEDLSGDNGMTTAKRRCQLWKKTTPPDLIDPTQSTISWCISQEILESQADFKGLTNTKNFFLSCDSAVQPPNSLF